MAKKIKEKKLSNRTEIKDNVILGLPGASWADL